MFTRSHDRRRLAMSIVSSVAALVVVAYVGAGWYLWWKQRELIFAPSPDVNRTPADVGLHYEEVWLRMSGGDSMHGWWLRSDDDLAAAVLYLHGNDLNIAGNVEHIAALRGIGFSVLIVDYRGYGKSRGDFPSERQLYEDAETAWDYLIRDLRVDPGRAFIYGHSLGGAVAVELALRRPEAAGLILESTFTSLADVAKIAYPMFPVGWLLVQRFDALDRIRSVRLPVLFIHGTADDEVPYSMSERLFAAAPEPKQLTLIAGGGHENSAMVGSTRYMHDVRAFAARHRAR